MCYKSYNIINNHFTLTRVRGFMKQIIRHWKQISSVSFHADFMKTLRRSLFSLWCISMNHTVMCLLWTPRREERLLAKDDLQPPDSPPPRVGPVASQSGETPGSCVRAASSWARLVFLKESLDISSERIPRQYTQSPGHENISHFTSQTHSGSEAVFTFTSVRPAVEDVQCVAAN